MFSKTGRTCFSRNNRTSWKEESLAPRHVFSGASRWSFSRNAFGQRWKILAFPNGMRDTSRMTTGKFASALVPHDVCSRDLYGAYCFWGMARQILPSFVTSSNFSRWFLLKTTQKVTLILSSVLKTTFYIKSNIINSKITWNSSFLRIGAFFRDSEGFRGRSSSWIPTWNRVDEERLADVSPTMTNGIFRA